MRLSHSFRHFILSITTAFLLLAVPFGCAVEFGNPSDEGDSGDMVQNETSISGTAAEGLAVAQATIQIWDAQGQTFEGGTTAANGHYEFVVSENAVYPLLVCAIREEDATLCSFVESGLAEGGTITLHLNPISLQASRMVLDFSVGAISDFSAEEIAQHLTAFSGDFVSTGQTLVDQVIGADVAFTLFNDDPSFVARSGESAASSTTTPSVADILLDGLGQFARRNGQMLNTFLVQRIEETTQATDPVLLTSQFQMDFSAQLLNAGVEASRSSTVLTEANIREDATNSISAIATDLETVLTEANTQSLNDTITELALNATIEALNTVLEEEEQLRTSLSENQFRRLVNNVVNVIRENVVSTLRSQQASDVSLEVLESAINNAARQAGFVIAQLEVTQDLNSSVLEELSRTTQSVIEVTTQEVVASSVASNTSDIDLLSAQTTEAQIHASTMGAINELVNNAGVSGVLKDSNMRPSDTPTLAVLDEFGLPTAIDQIMQVTLEDSSQVISLNRNGAIEFRIEVTVNGVLETLDFQGEVNNRSNKVEGRFRLQSNARVTGRWQASRMDDTLKNFKLRTLQGESFTLFSVFLEVPLEEGGTVTGHVVLYRGTDLSRVLE